MNSNEILLIINAITCAVISARLILFQRDGSRHRWWGGWIAYLIIVVSASVPIRTFFGFYVSADWSEILLNITLCVAVIRTRGNVMQLFKVK
ncbi:phage holin family protein [Yersinia rochesterensis]|uniref:phage holin family protein n=1 Tax=Yersinia rochesterensis TaxID=1604335 RepID=UPI00056E780D|nr:phage holin family protein [Yersinia rochesterensis]